jgi:hypothetical protein
MIRPDASPAAIAILLSAAVALAVWLMPRLPASWGLTTGPLRRNGTSFAAFVLLIVMAFWAWVGLRFFSKNRES